MNAHGHYRQLALALLLLSGLQSCGLRGESGQLMPIVDANSSNSSVTVSGTTVRITTGAVSAEVNGTWSVRTGDAVTVTYHNTSTTPFAFKWTEFSKKTGAREIALAEAANLTGVDLTDTRTDNDVVKPLYKADDANVKDNDKLPVNYSIAPKEKKTINLSFGNYSADRSTEKAKPIQSGDEIAIRFAMPQGAVLVRFKRS